ncbi:MAG: hypothetical protein EXS50_02670 [Candidatus Taylorbacteria bacterium]|nr:hypothetical protein [Candidatus Taylorbacteria bacterium]
MIYFLYGEDKDKARGKVNDLIVALQKKKPDAALFKMNDESYSDANLDEYMGGQGLFANKYIVFLDNVFRNKEAKEGIVKKIKEVGASENIFIMLEGKVDKATLTKIEKNAEKIQLFEQVETKSRKFGIEGGSFDLKDFNIFALADALAARDRKKLWLVYLETVKRSIASEEVSGILFWKVKDMIVKKNTRIYSPEELKKLSSRLVSIYHDAHRGLADFPTALEKFVLTI